MSQSEELGVAVKRRRVVPKAEQKHHAICTCCQCHEETCPGNSNILNCKVPCTVPCKTCKQVSGCHGVDGGKKCTYMRSNFNVPK